MNLPKIDELELNSKKILLRADLDIKLNQESTIETLELYRLEAILPTLRYLFEKNCEIYIAGHMGRPEGEVVDKLSTKPISILLEDLLKKRWGKEDVKQLKMQMLENLRFDKGEEANDLHFAQHLAEGKDIYINEAFAGSHRSHASIVTLPKLLPRAAGFRFCEEVEKLSLLRENPAKPFVVILGGAKSDKLSYAWKLAEIADMVLIGGRLPEYIPDNSEVRVDVRFEVAGLIADKEEITIHSIESFEKHILEAKTIFLSGPLGKYEDEGHSMGTRRVFEAIKKSSAHKVAGGGDTIDAMKKFGIFESFNWVSVGGGASLEFLANGIIPGLDALRV